MSDEDWKLIVLQALWVLILLASGKRPLRQLEDVRVAMLEYADKHGNPHGKEYRREVTYWWAP